MHRFRLAMALFAGLAAWPARGEEPVTVVSWGGAYEAAQRQAVFEPFTQETGKGVKIAQYSGGIESLRARAEEEGWDVVDMLESDAIAACNAGLLRRLDHDELLEPADGLSVRADFAPMSLRPCSIPQNVYATVIAYDDHAFPGLKPTRVEDFFDLERFPGKRAIEKRPDAILEWALMAEGVPPAQVYDLLSTDRGLRLAFRKLDEIRGSIVWWEGAGESADLLRDGEVSMASGYNGRFFSMAHEENAPVAVLWDGRLIGTEVWAVPNSADAEAAEQFLRFAARPAQMARLAAYIPYGPARRSAFDRIGLSADGTIPMRDHLPNAPRHDTRALHRDSDWYADTRQLRARRFEEWLAAGEKEERAGE